MNDDKWAVILMDLSVCVGDFKFKMFVANTIEQVVDYAALVVVVVCVDHPQLPQF